MTNVRPFLLDASYLVYYENDVTRFPQAVVLEAITDARVLLVASISLAAAAAELAGDHPELDFLLDDSPVRVLALSGENALDVGRRISVPEKADLSAVEAAQVVHEATAIGAVVLTYSPDQYIGHRVHIADMRSL